MKSEEPILSLSNFVNKQWKIADEKLRLTSKDHFEWDNIKRTPQLIKKKANIGFNTIDEEFDQNSEKLVLFHKKLETVILESKIFTDNILFLLDNNEKIGEVVNEFFSLSFEKEQQSENILHHDFLQNKEILYENVLKFINMNKIVRELIVEELKMLDSTICCSLDQIISYIKIIYKKIKNRLYAMTDYDKIRNSYLNLLAKKKKTELKVKESQKFYSLERKLEEFEGKYNRINDLLKKELPFFFKLVESLMIPLQTIIYYVQLMIYYQFQKNSEVLLKLFYIDLENLISKDFNKNIISEFKKKNKEFCQSVDKLSIINFRERFFFDMIDEGEVKCNESKENINEYCEALYNFKSQDADEISIKCGDVIKIIEKTGNWWKGENRLKIGFFPSNYTKLLNL